MNGYPSFLEYLRARYGRNWVIARRTARIIDRYGPDVHCFSPAGYQREMDAWRDDHPAVKLILTLPAGNAESFVMKQTSLKAIARHTAAVQSGKVEKTNIIGIRKAINSMEWGGWPPAMIDAQFELERAIAERRPVVVGALHESGLKVLRNPRYKKRWNPMQDCMIRSLSHFELIRFDRLGPRGRYAVPVYRAVATDGRSFAFRNIPWQTAYYGGFDDGPRVVPENER